MAKAPRKSAGREVDYPTSDGKPMAESDVHREVITDLITILQDHFADDLQVYVSGCLLLYYERGEIRKRVAPDVFVVRGVPKLPPRDYYLLWKEGKAPDVVIEVTSKRTRSEDQKKGMIYQNVLKVPEYFLFDPMEAYLRPSLQGYRRRRGHYLPIEPVLGRLPSAGLGLHLERSGTDLRLRDPASDRRLLTQLEQIAAFDAETRVLIAEAENERLRQALAEFESLLRRVEELERKASVRA